MSIDLNPDQQKAYQELLGYIHAIEKALALSIDNTEGDNIAYALNERVSLLSTCPKMMEIATGIYNWAKGEAANEAMTNEKILNAKADIQRKWFSGQLAKWEAIYVRAERCQKALDMSIEGLRSLLSYEKGLAKNLG